MKKLHALLGCVLAVVSTALEATETITYSYDAKGRLVKVMHTGTVNDNQQTVYAHDKADNRTKVTTTGAPPP